VRQVGPPFFPFSNSIQFPRIRLYTVIVIWLGPRRAVTDQWREALKCGS
jgi:hypothetical protein